MSRVRIPTGSLNNGNIAQLVEQGAVNSQVVGSEPTIPAKFWRNSALSIFYYGLACTKAGVSPLQGESGGFDSLRVHKNLM